MLATRLESAHHNVVRDFLAERTSVNLFLLGVLWRYGLQCTPDSLWLGVLEGGVPSAVLFAPGGAPGGGPAGTAVPEGDPAACELLGRELAAHGGTHMVVGPREPSDAVWRGVGDPPARIRFDQRLYTARSVEPGASLVVEKARAEDVPVLADYSGLMMAEDLGLDPRTVDPTGHQRRVRGRVARGSTWVHRREGRIAFCVDVGTDFALGAQIGGTFVPPEFRGQGIATAAMRGVTAQLLRRVPMVTLHVNEANLPAVRCYESAGFERDAPFRLVSW